jgi:serine/threonine-protein kinase
MLCPDGTIKVMDFGIARFAREDGKTLSDKTIGSVHYISPEQARGEITDEKSDIYSVGAMLYEMITGKKPFDADTPVAVALMHMQEIAKRPRDIIDIIPEGLEEITLHAMQKDAKRRYQSAAEMIKDLDTFKLNPSVVFGYGNPIKMQKEDIEQTIYFKPIAKPTPEKKRNEPEYEDDEDDEDDDDEPSRSSMLIHALTAVTVAVVVVAAVLIALILFDKINVDTEETFVPNLIGMNFADAVNAYEDFIIEELGQEYSADYAEGLIIWQDKAEKRQIKVGEKIQVKVSKGTKMVEIPNIANTSYDSAASALKLLGLNTERQTQFDDSVTKNYVISTDPAIYSKVPFGSTVYINVSLGPVNSEVIVPDIVGKTREEAESILNSFKLTPIYVPINQLDDEGLVLSQIPGEGETVQRNSTVQIYVSTGVLGANEYTLDLPIPQPSYGAYKIICYINGNIVAQETIDDAEVVQWFPITIPGTDTQDVRIEVQSLQTFRYQYYATYRIDFTNGNVIERLEYDVNAFQKANSGANTTTSSQTTTNSDTEPSTTTHPLENTD